MIGIELQNKRREKNIPLKKASIDTKIRMQYLIALEEENYDIFPADVYLKGFLRTYANYLGLNGDEFVRIYEQQHPEIRIKPEIELRVSDSKKLGIKKIYSKKIDRKNIKLIIVGVVVIIFIWLIPERFFYYSLRPAKENSTKADLVYDNTSQQDMLYLQADIKQVTWLRIVADGKDIEERNFYPGELKIWKAKNRFELRIGNVWGLDLKFNGKPIDIISPSKQSILDLTLDKDMLNTL